MNCLYTYVYISNLYNYFVDVENGRNGNKIALL